MLGNARHKKTEKESKKSKTINRSQRERVT